jgi:hypothetical protein
MGSFWGNLSYIGPAPRSTLTAMTTPFLKRLLQKCCPHRFSWPHAGIHGQDYQICLICGVAYEYDCTTMCQTGRLAATLDTRDEYLSRKQPSNE